VLARTIILGSTLFIVACGDNVRPRSTEPRDAGAADVSIEPIEGCPTPAANARGRWEVVPHPPGFSQRVDATVLAVDQSLAVLGGYNERETVTDNWLYDPSTNRWTALGAPWSNTALRYRVAAWIPSAREVFVWLPRDLDRPARAVRMGLDGAVRDVSREGFPQTTVARAVSVMGLVFVVGGATDADHNEFALYDPREDRWEAVLAPREQNARGSMSVATDGRVVFLWGGGDATMSTGPVRNDGWRFDVVTRRWSSVSRDGAPDGRHSHSALWIDDSMFIWGGTNGTQSPLAGGRYFSGPDRWLSVTTADAPVALLPSNRSWMHAVAWTGSDVFAWTINAEGAARAGRWFPTVDRWIEAEAPPDASVRMESASAWVRCAMYVVGGRSARRDAFASEVVRWVP
jgi:hypothetical protein